MKIFCRESLDSPTVELFYISMFQGPEEWEFGHDNDAEACPIHATLVSGTVITSSVRTNPLTLE